MNRDTHTLAHCQAGKSTQECSQHTIGSGSGTGSEIVRTEVSESSFRALQSSEVELYSCSAFVIKAYKPRQQNHNTNPKCKQKTRVWYYNCTTGFKPGDSTSICYRAQKLEKTHSSVSLCCP